MHHLKVILYLSWYVVKVPARNCCQLTTNALPPSATLLPSLVSLHTHSNNVPFYSLQEVKRSIAILTQKSEESKKILLEHQQATTSKLDAYQDRLKTTRREMEQEFEKKDSVLKELKCVINEVLDGLDKN